MEVVCLCGSCTARRLGKVFPVEELQGWHHDCGFHSDSETLFMAHVEECRGLPVIQPVPWEDEHEMRIIPDVHQ